MFIRYLFEDKVISEELNFDKEEIDLICDLIKGDYENYNEELHFLFDIVSNKNNSFDLDKLDYLNRDLNHTKLNESRIEWTRILNNTRIIENKICYDAKIHNDINIVF